MIFICSARKQMKINVLRKGADGADVLKTLLDSRVKRMQPQPQHGLPYSTMLFILKHDEFYSKVYTKSQRGLY